MEWQFLLKIVILGILHWVLAFMMLQDLAYRNRVLGGKKAVWAVLIIFFLIIGSLIYLLCHPQIFFGEDR
ncbi:MAG: hypothetical protein JXB43_01990 [Dehalococcoidia bacterium]|nr:hypothetical protein [Dehalococcoidia bacterium]